MKKVGIVTFHLAHNYGAVLQAYALTTYLKKYNNNDVEMINYYNKRVYGSYKIFKPFRKNLIKYCSQLLEDIRFYNDNKERYKTFEKFINNNFKLTKRFKNVCSLNQKNMYYDFLITGSDQVWNKKIVGELSDVYTLNILNGDNNIKKISYAASIGNTDMVKNNMEEYKNKLNQINYISVRENDAYKVLKEILPKEKKIMQVLDPTLLLTKKEWNEFLKNNQPECIREAEKYIIAYDVAPNDEFIKIANYVSSITDLKIIYFDKKNPGFKNKSISAYKRGPVSFVNYIKNAEYVITTSFHATVFSIIFNKKFFVIPHKQTGSRVISLLDLLNIKDRVYNDFDDFKNININKAVKWNLVEEKLSKEREKSVKWLKSAMGEGFDYNE